MTGWVAVGGWAAAAGGALVAIRSRWRLARHLELVGRACHEVRGPLTAARLGLTAGERTARLSHSRVLALERELERAARALEDLEHARTGSATQVLEWAAVDVRSLVLDSVTAWEGSAEARHRRLRHSWSGPPAEVEGDRVRLAQALGNLIANALEHGSGPVEVRAGSDDAEARVEVQDSGPGLAAPIAELVRRRSSAGRGHGLVIASSIAKAHGGRLSSAPSDRGARLVMTLPLAAARGRSRRISPSR